MPRKRSSRLSSSPRKSSPRRLSPSAQKIVINYVQSEVESARPGMKNAVFATAVSLAAIGLVGVGLYASDSVDEATGAVRDLCQRVFNPDAWELDQLADRAGETARQLALSNNYSEAAANAAFNAAHDAIQNGKTLDDASEIGKTAADNIYTTETGATALAAAPAASAGVPK